jgi:hypothetical protein
MSPARTVVAGVSIQVAQNISTFISFQISIFNDRIYFVTKVAGVGRFIAFITPDHLFEFI